MAVELVLMAPVLVAFLLLVIAAGRFVAVRGEIESASRDAARAASLERTLGAAAGAAGSTARAALDGRWNCNAPSFGGTRWVAGGTVTVTLTCRVSYSGLGLIGLPGSATVTGDSSAPLDLYRRTGS